MIATQPTTLRLSSFSPDGDSEREQTLRVPAGHAGQQSIELGDYAITLYADGSLTVELATLSGADRITVRRFHEASVTLRAADR